MKIKSLSQMEDIVKNNKNLSWDGWTVVSAYKTEKARTSKFGALIKNKWCMIKRFEPNRDGWDIPESFLNAQT